MTLELALNNALSGLRVSQNALSVVSHNIANANTPGYSRQIVAQSQHVIEGVGAGATVDDVIRTVDKYLERTLQRETSNLGRDATIDDYYNRIQILLGEPGADNSIDEYISDFFNSLQALAETPNFTSFRATAVDTGQVLAQEVSILAQNLEDLRYQADQDVTEAVSYINSLLEHLSDINISLNRAEALGFSSASLLDERDNALLDLSNYMDIETYFEDNGRVTVFTASGISLLDENNYELTYTAANDVDAFIDDSTVSPLQLYITRADGTRIGNAYELISSGVDTDIVSELSGGSLEGLHQIRDVIIPGILEQLDTLAANIRDSVNAVHNDGAGYPPATELTGTRLVQADAGYDWDGKVQIAVLREDGTPALSTYDDEEYTGYRPLTLDLDFLDSGGGAGAGVPTTQTIIDEINNHFNAPPVKAKVNNLNNIQLVSNNLKTPNAAPPTMVFDFDLENISATDSEFWVTNVTVLDDTGTDITIYSDTVPRIAVDPVNSYDFTNLSNQVDINTASPHGLQIGDRVYMNDPGLPALVAGGTVPSGLLVGYFEVVDVVDSSTFTIAMTANAGATVTEGYGAFDAMPSWQEVPAGEKLRSRDSGLITADFTNNIGSAYYDITVNVGVYADDDDEIDIANLTYRVYNNRNNLYNDRYDISSLTGTGEEVYPETPHQYIIAKLVDEDGNELSKVNDSYGSQSGYLQLTAIGLYDEEYTIAINELDSKQLGTLTVAPLEVGTNRAFSHYYELNNFFVSNAPTSTGDSTDGSAIRMAVEQRLIDNPALVATADLQLVLQPADPDATPLYTYEINESDNSVAQRLAGVASTTLRFDAAGELPELNLTISGYAGEFLGLLATQSQAAENSAFDQETLVSGFEQRADAISGVNIDEELANTVVYQHAYSASARVITVVGELFDALLAAF